MKYLLLAGRKILHGVAATFGFGVSSFRLSEDRRIWLRKIRILKKRGMLLTPMEAMQLVNCVKATANVKGDMAELGVYKGASARLMLVADATRRILLFDTFEGLPIPTSKDVVPGMGSFTKGLFACTLEDVRAFLDYYLHRVSFHKGNFPRSIYEYPYLLGEKYSFVHLDADLYESTLEGLKYFYPRLSPGGIILIHDAVTCPGVAQAIKDFVGRLTYLVAVELSGNQVMIIK